MNCPKCGNEVSARARFCEYDGTPIEQGDIVTDTNGAGRPITAICRCGAGPDAIDEAGYCTECGVRRTARPRDHIEIELAPEFAGVTDRGIRHTENQDDLAIAMVQIEDITSYVAVVCDGVSGSEGAANASCAAARTACAALEQGARDTKCAVTEAVMATAIAAANHAVCHLTYSHATVKDPPETTIVAAVVTGRTAVIGWAGDSRAYQVTGDGVEMLTRDHSWVNDVVDAGQMTEDEALLSPMAHAIVRCLGGASGGADEPVEPSIKTCELPEGARLLLCTDGLWNYAETLDEMTALVHAEPGETPLAATRRFVQFAVGKGGKDNITAVWLG
ncbi:MAG: protein phosphatase 2C domain-containing protein [Capsulimonadaceae bacterium]